MWCIQIISQLIRRKLNWQWFPIHANVGKCRILLSWLLPTFTQENTSSSLQNHWITVSIRVMLLFSIRINQMFTKIRAWWSETHSIDWPTIFQILLWLQQIWGILLNSEQNITLYGCRHLLRVIVWSSDYILPCLLRSIMDIMVTIYIRKVND